MLPETEYFDARQQLKDHIEAVIDDNFGLIEYKDDAIKELCHAVDIHIHTTYTKQHS